MSNLYLWFLLALSAQGCTDYLTKDDLTRASLKRINSAFDECKKMGVTDLNACLQDYASENGISFHALTTDGHGRLFLFKEKETECASGTPVVYSAGANGINDCGDGDDVY